MLLPCTYMPGLVSRRRVVRLTGGIRHGYLLEVNHHLLLAPSFYDAIINSNGTNSILSQFSDQGAFSNM